MSCMGHSGHSPGSVRRIWGCIAQVHTTSLMPSTTTGAVVLPPNSTAPDANATIRAATANRLRSQRGIRGLGSVIGGLGDGVDDGTY